MMDGLNLDWYLPLALGGQDVGLSDAGVEQFKRPQHLARETVQNIIDASDDTSSIPTVVFDRYGIDVDQVPGIEKFRSLFDACKARVDSGPSDKAKKFMERGADDLRQGARLSVLRIRDTHTVGLQGSDQDRWSRWYRLIRGQGTSNAEGAGGGTMGIGQRAPFAFTSMRLVFYSTMTEDGSCRFMGKFILCSCDHPDDGRPTQHIGFYGALDDVSGVMSISDVDHIPELFRRESVGTDIYIMGFMPPNLSQIVTCSVLTDFYAAIVHDKIVIRVHDEESDEDDVLITSENVTSVIDCEIESGRHKSEDKAKLISAKYGVEALLNPLNGEPYKREIDHLGEVRMYVCRSPEAGGIVHYMRSPRMVVYPKKHGQLVDYQAVVLVDDAEGNKYLSHLENSEHNRWSEDEAGEWSDAKKAEAKEVRLNVQRFAQEVLTEIRGEAPAEAEDIPELASFLPAESDDMGPMGPGRTATDEHSEDESPRRILADEPIELSVTKKKRVSTVVTGVEDGGGVSDGVDGGPERQDGQGGVGPGDGEGEGEGEGDLGGDDAGGRLLTSNDVGFRSWLIDANGRPVYRFVVSSSQSVRGSLALRSVGESGRYPVAVVKAVDSDTGENLSVSRSMICDLDFVGNQRRVIDVEIDADTELVISMGAES